MTQENKDDKTEGVEPPAKFKTGQKWKPFKEGCVTLFDY
jgi:hypothetical protein